MIRFTILTVAAWYAVGHAGPSGTMMVPDPHGQRPAPNAVRAPTVAEAPTRGGACSIVSINLRASAVVGSDVYTMLVDGTGADLNGDGIIIADAGYYDLFDPIVRDQVFDLDVAWLINDVPVATYANVVNSEFVYPFFYLQWRIGSTAPFQIDVGADPGIYCFGGSAISPDGLMYFIDNDEQGAAGPIAFENEPLETCGVAGPDSIVNQDVFQAVAVERGLVALASPVSGLVFASLEGTQGLSEEARITEVFAADVVLDCRRAIVAGSNNDAVHLFDVSDPADPALVSSLPLGERVSKVAADHGLGLAALEPGDVQILDVRTDAIRTIGLISGHDTADVAVIKDFAFVADRSGTVFAYDVSDPSSPTALASVLLRDEPRVMEIGNSSLLIGTRAGLEIIEYSQNGELELVGSLIRRGGVLSIAVQGNEVAMITDFLEVITVDVSDRCRPIETGRLQSTATMLGIALVGPTLLAATEVDQFQAFGRGCWIPTDTDSNGVPDYLEPIQNRTRFKGYGTIQAAINGAETGDLIEVAPGTYSETVDFLGRRVILRGECGPAETLLDMTGLAGSAVVFQSGETRESVLEGFTIANATTDDDPALLVAASPIIRDCIIRDNAGTFGGGARVIGSPLFERVQFVSNTASSNGAGVDDDFEGGTYINCLFAHNAATGNGGAILAFNSQIAVINCTFFGNAAGFGGAIASWELGSPTNAFIRNSIFADNIPETFGAINAATFDLAFNLGTGGAAPDLPGMPLFGDVGQGNYALAPGSPGIDAADSSALPSDVSRDLARNARLVDDPGRPNLGPGPVAFLDVGAHEFQGASPNVCPADLDGNGTLNFDDIDAFIAAFLGSDLLADLDGNGTLNFDDIDAFVSAFLNGCA